jgi:hypothetical protein
VHFDSRGIPAPLGTASVIYLHDEHDAGAAAAVEISAAGGIRRLVLTEEGWR